MSGLGGSSLYSGCCVGQGKDYGACLFDRMLCPDCLGLYASVMEIVCTISEGEHFLYFCHDPHPCRRSAAGNWAKETASNAGAEGRDPWNVVFAVYMHRGLRVEKGMTSFRGLLRPS